jgi:uncharacterized protein (DUF4415 family)
MSKSTKTSRLKDPNNPPLTRAQLARFRPSREVVPHIVEASLRRRGRPPEGEAAKVLVTLRLDPAVLAHFKAKGPGWQTRINAALMKAIGAKAGARRK